MTVDTISENKLKISLDADETLRLFGGYEKINYNDPDTKFALNILLRQALPEIDFKLNCPRLYVEVCPGAAGGCSIYFTKVNVGSRRYRPIKKTLRPYIFEFANCENAILASKELSKRAAATLVQSSFFRFGEKYRLILSSPIELSDTVAVVREFADTALFSVTDEAATNEYGKELIPTDAVTILAGL